MMKILQAGCPKSGNYWLYRILSEIKTVAGIKPESYIQNDPIYPLAKEWELNYREQIDIDTIDILPQGCFYRISSRYRNKISDFSMYARKTNHVWTHSGFCERSKEVFPYFDKIIYIIRDPRDIAVSSAKFAFTPYMLEYYPTRYKDTEGYLNKELSEICKKWGRQVVEYLESNTGIHFVFYERLLFDLDNELRSLLEYLQVELSIDKINSIKDKVSFNMIKDSSPNHTQKVKLYGWKHRLDNWQKLECLQLTKPLLQFLNYPLSNDEERLPGFASDLNPEMLVKLKRQLERKSLNQRIKMLQEALK